MKLVPLVLALALAACASGKLDAQQAVFQAESDYVAALKVAVVYSELPTCSDVVKAPCKTTDVLSAMKKADLSAQQALGAAEKTVRDPAFGGSVTDQAIVSATNAVGAFQNIVNIATGK